MNFSENPLDCVTFQSLGQGRKGILRYVNYSRELDQAFWSRRNDITMWRVRGGEIYHSVPKPIEEEIEDEEDYEEVEYLDEEEEE